MERQQPCDEFLRAVMAGDPVAAESVVRQLTGEVGYGPAAEALLTPVMGYLSSLWEGGGGALPLSQAYLAAKVVERCAEPDDESPGSVSSRALPYGPVVLGNIEDDYHALGRRLVGICLRAAGWRVVDLGNDVLPHAFVDTAVEAGARVIAVSAMIHGTARNIARVRDEIDRRRLSDRIRLAVGGAVFVLRPELAAQVGGDGTAASALGASRLMHELWRQASEVRNAS